MGLEDIIQAQQNIEAKELGIKFKIGVVRIIIFCYYIHKHYSNGEDSNGKYSNETSRRAKHSSREYSSRESRRAKEEDEEIHSQLGASFPNLFGQVKALPLKLKVHEDIWKTDFLEKNKITKKILAKFLKVYCRKARYMKRLKLDASRHDLEGNAVGQVTEEEINLAKLHQQKKVTLKMMV